MRMRGVDDVKVHAWMMKLDEAWTMKPVLVHAWMMKRVHAWMMMELHA